jgi:hypothetical protein
MRTEFDTFKSGDVVVAIDHPFSNPAFIEIGKHYVIDQMFDDAGIVSIIGFPRNKTFPEDIFRKVEDEQ